LTAVSAAGMAPTLIDCGILAIHFLGENNFGGGGQDGQIPEDFVVAHDAWGSREVIRSAIFSHIRVIASMSEVVEPQTATAVIEAKATKARFV